MSKADNPIVSSVVAVYPDLTAAERAVRHLHEEGFPLDDLSIVGRNLQEAGEDIGHLSRGDYAAVGAETGACFGWLFGLLVGAGFLVLPGLGPLVVAGPIAAALLGGVEGGAAGALVGSLAGVLIGWGVPKERAHHYQTHVEAGKFLLVVRSNPAVVALARSLLAAREPEHLEVHEPPAS